MLGGGLTCAASARTTMTDKDAKPRARRGVSERLPVSRRGFLGAVGGLAGGAAAVGASELTFDRDRGAFSDPGDAIEPFYGTHQGGIATAPQSHTYFAAFDLTTDLRSDLTDLLKSWTSVAANATRGKTAAPLSDDPERIEP